MRYLSTRGRAPPRRFDEVLLAGLAEDGGLYVPEHWPRLSEAALADLAGLPYPEVAVRVMRPFVAGAIDEDAFAAMVAEAYRGFDHAAVAPLVELSPDLWLEELFHGPTLAFKDIALQLVGRLFDHVLAQRGARVTVVGATSGDTGSAAIEALRDRANVTVCILHPKDRVSEVQRRQMTTVDAPNVHNLAIEGTFDDCQALLKRLLGDPALRARLGLAAVNSINWARVMPQTVYYVTAAVALGAPGRALAFAVPTGNFGDVYAGWVARRMGVPIARLVIATNRNDILARLLASGEYRIGEVVPTLSPSMDIQVASNFERLLHDLLAGDGARVAKLMATLAESGGFALGAAERAALAEVFDAEAVDDETTLATIAEVQRQTGVIVDPHTAVAIAAARRRRGDRRLPMVVLATAHPAKFAEAVGRALGRPPPMPERLARLMERPERYRVLPNDLAAVQSFLMETVGEAGRGAA